MSDKVVVLDPNNPEDVQALCRAVWPHSAKEDGSFDISFLNRTINALVTLLPQPRPEPTEPGWYAYSGGSHNVIFHLRDQSWLPEERPRQWSAHFADGSAMDCVWAYIEQALSVWKLERVL